VEYVCCTFNSTYYRISLLPIILERSDVSMGTGARVVRRRPTPQQGKALEVLGHAIEYLMDSYVLTHAADTNNGDHEAAQILMGLSRMVFEECAEIVPLSHRVRLALLSAISAKQ
jgi:hypothetical protein